MPVIPSSDPASGSSLLDLLTLSEAKRALNIEATDDDHDAELASFITAVSQAIDDRCGYVVKRTITATYSPDEYMNGSLILTEAPASPTADNSITTVTEYSSGTAQVLAAETVTTSTSYDYSFNPRTGIVSRRSTWAATNFAGQNVVVVYVAGRYDDTASVAPKFKQAAAMMLKHLWVAEQGVGGSAVFGASDLGTSVPGFSVPNAVLELLSDELRAPAVA